MAGRMPVNNIIMNMINKLYYAIPHMAGGVPVMIRAADKPSGCSPLSQSIGGDLNLHIRYREPGIAKVKEKLYWNSQHFMGIHSHLGQTCTAQTCTNVAVCSQATPRCRRGLRGGGPLLPPLGLSSLRVRTAPQQT
jgi:hypothetical protein